MTTSITIELNRNNNDVNWKVKGTTDCNNLRVIATIAGRNVMRKSGKENVIGSGGVVELGSIVAVRYSATATGKLSPTGNERAGVSGTLQRKQNFVAIGDTFP